MAGFDSICVVFKNGQIVKELTKRYDVELELSNDVKLYLFKGRVRAIGLKETYTPAVTNVDNELLVHTYLATIAGKRKVSKFNYLHCAVDDGNKAYAVAWERSSRPLTFNLEGLSFKVEGGFAGKTNDPYPTKRHCNDYKNACNRFHPNEKPFYLDEHHPIALKAGNKKGVRVSYFYEIYTVKDVNGDVYTFFTTMNYKPRNNCIFEVVAKRFNTTRLALFNHIDSDSEVDKLNSFFG